MGQWASETQTPVCFVLGVFVGKIERRAGVGGQNVACVECLKSYEGADVVAEFVCCESERRVLPFEHEKHDDNDYYMILLACFLWMFQ